MWLSIYRAKHPGMWCSLVITDFAELRCCLIKHSRWLPTLATDLLHSFSKTRDTSSSISKNATYITWLALHITYVLTCSIWNLSSYPWMSPLHAYIVAHVNTNSVGCIIYRHSSVFLIYEFEASISITLLDLELNVLHCIYCCASSTPVRGSHTFLVSIILYPSMLVYTSAHLHGNSLESLLAFMAFVCSVLCMCLRQFSDAWHVQMVHGALIRLSTHGFSIAMQKVLYHQPNCLIYDILVTHCHASHV